MWHILSTRSKYVYKPHQLNLKKGEHQYVPVGSN